MTAQKLKFFTIISTNVIDGGRLLLIHSRNIRVSFMPVRKRRGRMMLGRPAISSVLSNTYDIILVEHVSLFVKRHYLMISLHGMVYNKKTVTSLISKT